MRLMSFVLFAALLAGGGFASPSYTGYSGAPGSRGTCAGSCHGSSGGTVTVTGFPSAYVPGLTYNGITLRHAGGSSINNFNASVRIGSGSQTAGTITAGLNTVTYNRAEEPNGVHLSSNNRDSCTFNWTAPAAGTGLVTRYVAAHQGTSMSGPNTTIVLTADEGTGTTEPGSMPDPAPVFELSPTVVSGHLVMRVSGTAESRASLRIVDAGGRLIVRFRADGPNTAVFWAPVDQQGRRLPDGAYFAVLQCGSERTLRRFVVRAN
jgi:hypothetical protein